MLQLKNNHLSIEMEEPGSDYSCSRYDHGSFVTSMKLADGRELLDVESRVPGQGSGGKGLCGEFSMLHPPGYEQTAIGEHFVKIGVGLVDKNSEDYEFWIPSKLVPIQWSTEHNAEQITLSCRQSEHAGIAYKLSKTYTLQGNKLICRYRLENTGSKEMMTQEYVHNYFNFNDAVSGPDYETTINYDASFSRFRGHLEYCDRTIKFHDHVPANMAEPPFCEDFIQCRGKLGAWELRHKKEGICVREDLSKPMFKFGFFATSHAVCPELFVDIHVEPGSSFEWSRTWSIELY